MNPTVNQMLLETLIHIDGAYAPSTIRAYKANFQRFIEFSESLQANALPAHPMNVANYVKHLAKSGLKSASIRIAVAAISSIHKLNELKDPTRHTEVVIEMKRMHRTLGRVGKQALGITMPTLEKMIAKTSADLRGARDRALLLLAYDSLCRRTELVSLKIEDIVHDDRGIPILIRLRKSKTDQEAVGKVIRITPKTQGAIKKWINAAKISAGFLFRGVKNNGETSECLSPGQINRIYKRMALAAKIPKEQIKGISGHSIRVGAAQDLIGYGASLPILMNRGRWSKPDTAMRYVEAIEPSSTYLHKKGWREGF